MTHTRPDLLLWLDLETTGSHPDSHILEIGMALTTPDLELVDEYFATVRPSGPLDLWSLDPTVIEMHAKSGLWRDILNDDPTDAWSDLISLDDDINVWIDKFHPSRQHIALCGSGVSHFDRQFIRRDLPRLNQRLTYWAFDVGVLRRSLNLWGITVIAPDDAPQTNHRALTDVRAHIAEFRQIRTIVQGALA